MMQYLFLLIELLTKYFERKQKTVNKKTSLADKIEININIGKG